MALHILVWRMRLANRSVPTLLYIFGFTYIVCAGPVVMGLTPVSMAASELIRATFVAGFTLLVYLSFYTAVERQSASASMLLHVKRHGSQGVPVESLYHLVTDDEAITSRLDDLVASGWLTRTDDRHRLSPVGKTFLWICVGIRRAFTNERCGG